MFNFNPIKTRLKRFPVIFSALVLFFGLLYFFSFVIPFTNNGFVVANITPVAADVSGFITDIYVKNGNYIKKGAPLFKVFADPYQLTYNEANYQYLASQEKLQELINKTHKNQKLLKAKEYEYQENQYIYNIKNKPMVKNAVSQMEVKALGLKVQSLANQVAAIYEQLKIDDNQVKEQQAKIKALKSKLDKAKVFLDLTTVRALVNGVVNNLYLAKGSAIIAHQPLFSLVDLEHLYIQANFNETDLRWVHPGSKVLIIPRMYFGSKVYHGIVVGNVWGVERQITTARSQLQHVTENEDNWILLPQRLPVQIKITDYDNRNYPLSIGSSVYVLINVFK